MLKSLFKILIALILIALVSAGIFYSQAFQHDTDSLSKIYFYRILPIPFHKKATSFISYISNDPKIEHIYFQKIRAKARGGSTEDFPKHNFTIELASKHQLAGLGNEVPGT